MSLTLTAEVEAATTADRAWAGIANWSRQADWIPMTTVTVLEGSPHAAGQQGVGMRVHAFSGIQFGRRRFGLLDRMVVTSWSPPTNLEVLHLGPVFTGEGVFTVAPTDSGVTIGCTEVFSLPGGRPIETVVRLILPIFRAGLQQSLQRLARLLEDPEWSPR